MALHRGNVAHRRLRRAPQDTAAAARTACCIAVAFVFVGPATVIGTDLRLPDDVVTHDDGRLPIEELYTAYLAFEGHGWHLEVIAQSQPAGTSAPLPIIALRSPRPGPAVWILSGIHGEEPAGPNAIAAAIEELAALGEHVPMVLIPLCNPQGYVRNWRYLNTPHYSKKIEGESVGDCSHLLQDTDHPGRPRAAAASSPEADALTRYIVRLSRTYPPRYSIDLHEDNLIPAGYVYSQGEFGADDDLAAEAVNVLRDSNVPIQIDGQTRFGEDIVGGIIGPVADSSIDELMGAGQILVDGTIQPGPSASTVLVFETPARNLAIDRRIAAHLSLLRRLARLIASESGSPPPP